MIDRKHKVFRHDWETTHEFWFTPFMAHVIVTHFVPSISSRACQRKVELRLSCRAFEWQMGFGQAPRQEIR